MKKISLVIALLIGGLAWYPANAAVSDPENLVQVLVDAAKTKNYSSLESLCLPRSDLFSQSICKMSQQDESIQDGFSQGYSTLEIDGKVTVQENKAEVPVSGVGVGESQQKATLLLEQEGGSWYLVGIRA